MRVTALAVGVLAGVLVPGAASAPPKPIPGGPITIEPIGTLTAKALPASAGARPAQLTLQLRTELRCGRPGPGPIVVSLPPAAHVPAHIAVSAVTVDGGTAAVNVSGHVVAISPKHATGVTCDVFGPGTISVVFTRAAGLGNPRVAGSYEVTLRAEGRTGHTKLVVS